MIDLRAMGPASNRGWGPGWPVNRSAEMAKVTVNGVSVWMHRELAPLVLHTVQQTEAMGYTLHPGECWGFCCRPIRGTNSPSNHCLGGDTMVTTWDGPRPIADLAGETARLLTKNGRWVNAPIRSYGVETTASILLRRGKEEKKITASWPHRWFVEPAKGGAKIVEKTTANLATGDRLVTSLPARLNRLTPSPFGVCHGIVYGDGTVQPGQGTKVTLWNSKRDLLAWFPSRCPTSSRERDSGCVGVEIRMLPAEYKTLPSLNAPTHYLAGWLAGYFATDGHARSGELRLSSRDLEILKFVAVLAARLGIACREPRVEKQSGGYAPDDQWSLAFIAETVPEWLLIRPEHASAFGFARATKHTAKWQVIDVIPKGEEEVFCASVPGTGCFTLDGWILTGNSWGLAIDLNAPENPMGATLITDIPPAVVEMWKSFGFRWGGDYTGRKDAMHMEFMGTPADARATVEMIDQAVVPLRAAVAPKYQPPVVMRPIVSNWCPPEGGAVLLGDDGSTYAFGGANYPGHAPQPPANAAAVNWSLEAVVDDLRQPTGALLLAVSGAIYAVGGATYRGADAQPFGHDYFANRVAAKFEVNGNGYNVLDTANERYQYP